jgi:hypothetical protein
MNRILSLQNVGMASTEEVLFDSTQSNNCSSQTTTCTGVTTGFDFL